MNALLSAVLVLLCAVPCAAQDLPVRPVPDWASYGTAMVNPAVAAYNALTSSTPKCKLAQLAIAEAVGNGVTIGLKRWRFGQPDAVRPCAGCAPDGDPSGHSMNATIGAFETGWVVGASFSVGTGILRNVANRHTKTQVVKGLLIGVGANAAGRLLKCST